VGGGQHCGHVHQLLPDVTAHESHSLSCHERRMIACSVIRAMGGFALVVVVGERFAEDDGNDESVRPWERG
jgi:hypothetical protein